MSTNRKRVRDDSASAASSSRGQTSISRPKYAGKSVFKRDLSGVQERTENEELDERMGEESQKMTEIVKNAATGPRKTEGFVKMLRDQIDRDKIELKKELRNKVKKVAERDARLQRQLQQYLPALHTTSSRGSDRVRPLLEPTSKLQAHSLEDIASSLISSSQDLIRDYTNMCKMTTATAQHNLDEVTKEWEGDKTAVTQLLENGKKLSLRRIEQLIPEDNRGEKSDVSSEAWYNETSQFFSFNREDTRLQDTFRQVAKGVRRMAREIPKKEC